MTKFHKILFHLGHNEFIYSLTLSRLGKRQDKPIPKPVPLTEEERRSLAREGIRGLYRIEPAGNEEGEHVKYVLALGKPLPSH